MYYTILRQPSARILMVLYRDTDWNINLSDVTSYICYTFATIFSDQKFLRFRVFNFLEGKNYLKKIETDADRLHACSFPIFQTRRWRWSDLCVSRGGSRNSRNRSLTQGITARGIYSGWNYRRVWVVQLWRHSSVVTLGAVLIHTRSRALLSPLCILLDDEGETVDEKYCGKE